MKSHFVTGASGFLGRHLVRALLSRGDRVIVLLREKEGVTPEVRLATLFPDKPKNLSVVSGDITLDDLGISEDTKATLRDVEFECWHLAADLSFDIRDQDSVVRTNVNGTRNVVRFANTYATRLWHMSTAYAQGEPLGLIQEEGLVSLPKFRNHYEKTKYGGEVVVRRETMIPYVVVRPSIVLGDAYRAKALGCAFGYYRYLHILHRFKCWLGRVVLAGGGGSRVLRAFGTKVTKANEGSAQSISVPWLFLPEPRGGVVNVVPVEYVIDAMLHLANTEHHAGTTVHLVHDNPPTYAFLLDIVLRDLNVKGAHHLPVPLSFFAFGLNLIRTLIPSMRVYAHSALWYVPYIAPVYAFETTATRALGIPPPPVITETYMSRVNNGAIRAIEEGSA